MEVLPMMLLVSLVLVGFGVLAMLYSVKQRDHEHADRLALAPLRDDDPPPWQSADPEE
jgi:cbb3-type cytochrome oxidase maturation protein